MNNPLKKNIIIDNRYRIDDFIDKGGMQYVYKAHDLILDRTVALKTPQNTSSEKRFKRSAVVAAKINHPNVAKTLDYIDIDNRQYLIEELIEGKDIQKTFLNGMKYIDPYLVAKIFHHLSKGIAASHHVGVIHRDLKPSNVMISDDFKITNIKITDFGIAKMAEEELIEAMQDGDTATIGRSQTAMGAIPYMAPEAIESPATVNTPADIWSIGAMMYELLTGDKPFGNGLQAVHKIIEAKLPIIPPFVINNTQFSALSKEIVTIIFLCLQKDTNARPNADELVEYCAKFCYPTSERYIGIVKNIQHSAWGFISHDDYAEVFFHLDSVYGEKPSIGSKVWFSKFVGEPYWRAHPVICLK